MIQEFCQSLAKRLRTKKKFDARVTGNNLEGHWVHIVMDKDEMLRKDEILDKLKKEYQHTHQEFLRKINNHRLTFSQMLIGANFEYLDPSDREFPSVGMGFCFADFRQGASEPTLLFKPILR
jgi:hypothetical protein